MEANKKMRLLSVVFDAELKPWEVSAFRGAMASKVGWEHDWFHNHDNGDNDKTYFYRYPLIQYKTLKGKPQLLCIENGVEEAHHFFTKSNWSLNIKGKVQDMRIYRLNLMQYDLRLNEDLNTYRLYNWLGLNQQNYRMYEEIDSIVEKVQFLEKKLIGHILAFAEGVGWEIKDQIKVQITQNYDTKSVKFKGNRMNALNFDFKTNVFLPNSIGLGRGVSHGFGIVQAKRAKRRRMEFERG